MASATPPVLPVELYRAEHVREFDRIAIQERGIPGYTLMCRAGEVAFAALRRRWPQARYLVAVCGGGNNGGDGYVVARLAHQAGMRSRVLYLSAPEGLRGDAQTAYRDAKDAGVPFECFAPSGLQGADVIIDAVFGTGLQREVQGAWRVAVDALNAHAAPVIAIDIPSGLHADTGAILGAAVFAELTVTFIALKQGLFSGQGPGCCGEVEFADLGVPVDVLTDTTPTSYRYHGEDLPQLLPRRPRSAHKGHHGHVLVVGGDHGMAGAARMAGEAAARCGAGLVSVATRGAHAGLQAAVRPELMFHGTETGAELQALLGRATVVAVGPGLGRADWGRALFQAVLATDLPLVVDADGLNLLAGDPQCRGNWILTPHPGEAARLLGVKVADIESDRFGAVAEIRQRYGGVAVLKGSGSLVIGSDGRLAVCGCGNPGMGSGGMGDVLTGVIAGLSAQGMTMQRAARAGVYVHGRAGDLAAADGERGLLATDLMPLLRTLVNP